MNTYTIQYKVATVAELIKPFEYDGYNFSSFDDWWKSEFWVITKKIEAEDIFKAYNSFYLGMIPLIERFSVISQCAFRIAPNSFFVYKHYDNPKNAVYLRYIKSASHTGLHFDEKEIKQISKFDCLTKKEGLLYISEAANVTTYYGRLAMLIVAAEGFASEITKEKNGKTKYFTNHVELKSMLGENLHKKLYEPNIGLRNILFHGKLTNQPQFNGIAEEVYGALLGYLKKTCGINFEENVVHPQRHSYGNFLEMKDFWYFDNEVVLDIKKLEQDVDTNNPNHGSILSLLGDKSEIKNKY